jgi:putative Mg2+ transporter-C (MgtC) family protein
MEFGTQELTLLLRVAAAMLFAGVLGFERELGRHSAGLRTHMLIGGAAALIVGLGDALAEHFVDERYGNLVTIDPVRLIEAVVAGAGFVAGGTILRGARDGESDRVRGLTTASSLVMAAAIGVAAGVGEYTISFGVSLLCVLVLALLGRFERRLPDRSDSAN